MSTRFSGWSRAAAVSLVAVAAMSAGDAAHAQDAAAQKESASGGAPGVGEIIVTAQRREESVNKVPISITALSGDQLRDMNIRDVADLTRVVPGFTEAKSAGGTPIYTIRGIGFNTDSMSATSPVGIYVDEVAYAYPYMSTNILFDMERVEVLKGPQGTLYGRNTTGGLVNFVPAKPSDTFEAGVAVEAGNFLAYDATAYVTGPLAEGLSARLALRVNGRADEWQRSVTRDDELGKAAQQAGRAILAWDGGGVKLTLTGSFWRDRSDTQAPQAIAYDPQQPAFGNPLGSASVITGKSNRDADWTPLDYPGPFANGYERPPYRVSANFQALSGRAEFDLDDNHQFISLTGFNHVDREQMTDKVGTQLETAGRYAIGKINSFSQEFRITGQDGPATWLVGAYYGVDKVQDELVGFDTDMSIIGLLRSVAASVPSSYTPDEIADGFRAYRALIAIRDKTFGVFGNVDLELSDQFKLIVGARYTKEKQRFEGCSADFMGNTAPIWNTALAAITGTNVNLQPDQCLTYKDDFSGSSGLVTIPLNEDNFSFKGTLNWTPQPGTLFYASFSRGYKAGAFPFSSANVEQQLLPAKQEEVLAYEVGTKLSLADRKLQLNMAGYYYDYRDKQLSARVFDPVFGTLQRLVNIPKSVVYGFEADLTGRVAEGLTFRLSGNYLHTEVKDFTAFTLAGTPANFDGEAFQLSPKWMGTASVDYETPVSDALGAGFSVGVNYQSGSKGQLESNPLLAINARALVDASIFLFGNDSDWKVSLWGKNLLDKYYWTNTDSEQDSYIRFTGMPRTFGISFSTKFR